MHKQWLCEVFNAAEKGYQMETIYLHIKTNSDTFSLKKYDINLIYM